MDCSMPGLPVHHQLWVYSDSCPLSRWCHRTISSSVVPFSCLQSFPASNESESCSSCPLFVAPWTEVPGILQARILEWVAIHFCRGSSQPRDRTQISCTAGRFFTSWATREALPSGSFLMSQFFATGGQSTGASASASVLPMNIQDWFPLGNHKALPYYICQFF